MTDQDLRVGHRAELPSQDVLQGDRVERFMRLPDPKDDPTWACLRAHDVEELWDPAQSPHIAATYQARMQLLTDLVVGLAGPGGRVLDVGCAQGTLGLTARRARPARDAARRAPREPRIRAFAPRDRRGHLLRGRARPRHAARQRLRRRHVHRGAGARPGAGAVPAATPVEGPRRRRAVSDDAQRRLPDGASPHLRRRAAEYDRRGRAEQHGRRRPPLPLHTRS